MIAQLPRWSSPRTARYLVGWWIGSVFLLSWFAALHVVPVDIRFQWLSVRGFEIIGFIAVTWLVPGFLLGGWKTLLVAAGRSSIRTGTGTALIAVFGLWAIGWPLVVVLVGAGNVWL